MEPFEERIVQAHGQSFGSHLQDEWGQTKEWEREREEEVREEEQAYFSTCIFRMLYLQSDCDVKGFTQQILPHTMIGTIMLSCSYIRIPPLLGLLQGHDGGQYRQNSN